MKHQVGFVILIIIIILSITVGAFIQEYIMEKIIVDNFCGQYNSQTGDFEYIKK